MSSSPQSPGDPASGRDEQRVRAYVESLALTLSQIGFPRMPARVFAALTVSDEGRMSSADLAEALEVSPAAISGAVRYLEQVGLISKERQPGERRDHYQLYDDFWFASFLKRDRMLRMWRDTTAEGVEAVGPDTPAGLRLSRMADFLAFVVKEVPALFDRWHEERMRTERGA
ncbi:GbsR/MarR family transcriptional regulator [Prauserella cavernicola]|uniref:MarR family transcriptional regulator n=1 Tax=Prauserella cavernicola TaxID=2800127 RepID=A0A934QTB3_9PSEU|nr:MarR family transcriptional regulator [Prauserella cavernicola]MBK1784979.1 MarR family transcriptional regulator [Prauserella cavernicola]